MAKVLIGNFKGPKGDKGDKGDRGPQGPKGEQGPVGLVNADAAIEFEDYTTEGVEVPTPEAAMAEIVSGKSLKGIISNIKAFFKGVVTLGMIVNNLDDVLAVEEGTVLPVGCKALQEVSAKTNVTQAELFSFADGITTNVFRAYRVGHTITFHMECVTTSNISYGGVIGTFKSPYRPGISYIVVPVRNNSSSFSEMATLWIRNNGNGILYGTIASGTRFYIQGSFTY